MPFGAEMVAGGVRFRLWAPAARRVALEIESPQPGTAAHSGAKVLLLHATAPGWFELVTGAASAGSRYRYVIDGDVHVPDPASRFQPADVHGPSEVIDPAAYRWSNDGWLRRPWHELVFYELHVGAFTPEGTYRAAIRHLDELAALGITAIELMPLSDSPGRRNWGYDGVLPYAPESAYGRPDDLKAFVEAAHARKLAVFLDVVYNHFGPEGNRLQRYAPQFFTDRRHTPWGSAIDFAGPREVRDFFEHNAEYWLEEYHIDGLRLDAVHAVFDDSQPDVLTELATRLVPAGAATADGRAYAVLENDDNAAWLLRSYAAQWNDDVHHALHVLVTGERVGYYADYADDPVRHLGRALTEGFAYQGEPSAHRGGAERGEPSGDLQPTSFVTFLQNHDQVGNRARGERIGQLAPHHRVRAAAAVLLLAPSLPLLFMGEEWAASTPFLFFCDFEPGLAKLVRDGRRREYGAIPDPSAAQSFTRSKLRWQERGSEPHRTMLELYRELLRLRREHVVPLLERRVSAAAFTVAPAKAALGARWTFATEAPARGPALVLLANLSDARVERHELSPHATKDARLLFDIAPPGEHAPGLAGALAPWSVAWSLEP
jgi:maltooligosyltrehalose trehalohydrolase